MYCPRQLSLSCPLLFFPRNTVSIYRLFFPLEGRTNPDTWIRSVNNSLGALKKTAGQKQKLDLCQGMTPRSHTIMATYRIRSCYNLASRKSRWEKHPRFIPSLEETLHRAWKTELVCKSGYTDSLKEKWKVTAGALNSYPRNSLESFWFVKETGCRREIACASSVPHYDSL